VAATPHAHEPDSLLERGAVPAWVVRAHEGAAVGAAVIGPDATLLWVNRAMLDLVASPGDELIGRSVAELVHQGDGERTIEALAALGHQPVSMARVQGRAPGTWLQVSLSMLPSEADQGRAILAQAVDVTGSVQAQVSLEVMSENVLDVVALIDDAGRITWASPSVRAVLGPDSDSAQIIGREITGLIAHGTSRGSPTPWPARSRGRSQPHARCGSARPPGRIATWR
jgi:PAS domain S-box-containing protein